MLQFGLILAVVVAIVTALVVTQTGAITSLVRGVINPQVRSITLGRGAQLSLRGTKYDLSGWMEIESRGDAQRLAVLNLSAKRSRSSGENAGAPVALHISRASDSMGGTFDFGAGRGTIDVAVTAAYDELEATRERLESLRGPRLTVTGRASFTLATTDGRTTLRGSGTIERLPPFTDDESDFDFDVIEVAVTGRKCGEVTLCLDVAMHGHPRVALLDQPQLDDVIKEVNRIWGCPGQCCIKFKAGAVVRHDGSDTVTLHEGNHDDEVALGIVFRGAHHGDQCYPVRLTGEIMTGAGGGGSYDDLGGTITRGDDITHGSVVSTLRGATALTPVAVGGILAHELGHAMGISNVSTHPDDDGVTHHSKKQDNLMRESGTPTDPDATLQANTKLNAKQCEAARNSPLVKQTQNDCGNAPLEAV